jgi:predicted lipoprotein with Yx(FWY)xxD motif
MRTMLAMALLLSLCGSLPAGAQTLATPGSNTPPDLLKGYPAEVALSDEGQKGFVFRRFPGSQRLYTYDRDTPDHSNCNFGCDGARPPVSAPPGAKPVGDWTLVKRDDGNSQWAYKGHPVYTLFHDDPGNPGGDGEDGVWHLLPYVK